MSCAKGATSCRSLTRARVGRAALALGGDALARGVRHHAAGAALDGKRLYPARARDGAGGAGLVVRARAAGSPHRQRRAVRHAPAHRRASHPAYEHPGAGDQFEKRAAGGGANKRSRSLFAQADHRSQSGGGGEARHTLAPGWCRRGSRCSDDDGYLRAMRWVAVAMLAGCGFHPQDEISARPIWRASISPAPI